MGDDGLDGLWSWKVGMGCDIWLVLLCSDEGEIELRGLEGEFELDALEGPESGELAKTTGLVRESEGSELPNSGMD